MDNPLPAARTDPPIGESQLLPGCTLKEEDFDLLHYVKAHGTLYSWGEPFQGVWSRAVPKPGFRNFRNDHVQRLIAYGYLTGGPLATITDIGARVLRAKEEASP